jgi:MFS family permease
MLEMKECIVTEVVYPKFRWFVLIAYVVVTTSTAFSMIAPAPLIGEIVKTMGIDPGVATAATMMSFNLFMGVFAFIGGYLLDKIGVSRMWIICLAAVAAGSLLVPVIGTTIPGLVICRLLHAAGTGPIMASIAAISSQRFKPGERTYVAAFQGFSVAFGVALGLSAVPRILAITGNWISALAWTSVFPIVAIIFGLIVLFGPQPQVVHASASDIGAGKASSGDFKVALAYSTIYVLALMGLIDSWCQRTYDGMMPGFYAVASPTGLGLGAMGAVKLSLAPIFMMAGALVAPFVNDVIFRGNPKPTIFTGLSISAVAILTVQKLTPNSGDFMLIGIPCVVLFFSSFVNPTIFGYVAKHYPSTIAGRLGGFVMFFFVFGSTFGLGISSYLLSKTHSYSTPFLLLAVVTFLGAVTVLFLKPPKGFEPTQEHASAKAAAKSVLVAANADLTSQD